ncbi:hypothetical protein BMAFMH_B0271, partial [Burkholderia mallei FMH]
VPASNLDRVGLVVLREVTCPLR